MHTTELHIFNDRLLMYHEYTRKIHLLFMPAINVSTLSNRRRYLDRSTAIMRTQFFGSDPATVNLDPIRIEFNPDYNASADTPLVVLLNHCFVLRVSLKHLQFGVCIAECIPRWICFHIH